MCRHIHCHPKNNYTRTKFDIHFQDSLDFNLTFKILKIHDKDWMIDFGIKGWNHSFSVFNNGQHLMNFNINYHFANFEEYDKLFDRNLSA